MSLLFVTADKIDPHSGGGLVALHQSEALKSLGPCEVWDRTKWRQREEPWGWDNAVSHYLLTDYKDEWPKLAHFYSGTFGDSVGWLKHNGCKVVYSLDPHDKEVSEREHRQLGMDFPYPHLTDPVLWNRYIDGYRQADVIICSSSVGAGVVRNYGDDFKSKRIEVIPHGCVLPKDVKPLPKMFTVGYLGAIGPDKGLRYLFEAWGKLNYKDALLVIAGKESTHPVLQDLWGYFGGGRGNVHFAGWQSDLADFYGSLSLYVQPSATEGFGIEVLEAMAHCRTALVSRGAGAQDVVPEMTYLRFNVCDTNDLAEKIDFCRKHQYHELHSTYTGAVRTTAEKYTWDKIRERYIKLWKEVLGW